MATPCKIRIMIDGKSRILRHVATELGISFETLRWRAKQGWDSAKLKAPAYGLADLTGQKVHAWTVLGDGEPMITPKLNKVATLRCQCQCGTIRNFVRSTVRQAIIRKSCGCLSQRRALA